MNSTTPNDGGPAFPTKMPASDPRTVGFYTNEGMTLRDWFAGQALVGYMAIPDERRCPEGENVNEWRARVIRKEAEFLYAYADAMLAERSKVQ